MPPNQKTTKSNLKSFKDTSLWLNKSKTGKNKQLRKSIKAEPKKKQQQVDKSG